MSIICFCIRFLFPVISFPLFIICFISIEKLQGIKPFGFWQIGSHHTKEDFAVRGKEPKDEVQIYTWKDATLRELTDLVDMTVFLIVVVDL